MKNWPWLLHIIYESIRLSKAYVTFAESQTLVQGAINLPAELTKNHQDSGVTKFNGAVFDLTV